MQGRMRILLALTTTLALAACGDFNKELGAEVDNGNFGNATMNNTMLQTGAMDYRVALGQRFASEVPSTVTFPFNSSQLTGEAMAALDHQANWMRQFPELRFSVYGHTDLVGSNTYNRQLGLRRAEAAVLARLRRERPSEFVQTERQYGTPKMDLYRLDAPVDAWGNEGDAVVITDDRVLLLVDAPIDTASMRLEQSLADSREAPLSGALDDLHALVVDAGEHPGMQQRTLIGCEYRMPGLSLLANPDDAWRTPTP